MPKKNSQLSKKTSAARRQHERRLNETEEERHVRLLKSRIANCFKRAAESSEQREMRLRKERERISRKRKRKKNKEYKDYSTCMYSIKVEPEHTEIFQPINQDDVDCEGEKNIGFANPIVPIKPDPIDSLEDEFLYPIKVDCSEILSSINQEEMDFKDKKTIDCVNSSVPIKQEPIHGLEEKFIPTIKAENVYTELLSVKKEDSNNCEYIIPDYLEEH